MSIRGLRLVLARIGLSTQPLLPMSRGGILTILFRSSESWYLVRKVEQEQVTFSILTLCSLTTPQTPNPMKTLSSQEELNSQLSSAGSRLVGAKDGLELLYAHTHTHTSVDDCSVASNSYLARVIGGCRLFRHMVRPSWGQVSNTKP